MKHNRFISTILMMTLCLSMVSLQAQAQQVTNQNRDLAATPTSSHMAATAHSFVQKLEMQFPSLAPQMQARSQFTTKEEAVAGQTRRFIVPVVEEVEAATPEGLQPEEAAAWKAAANRTGSVHQGALQLGYPARYDEVMVVEAHGVRAELRALQANAAPVGIEDGKAVYRGVYPGTDSLQVYRNGQSEEFLLLQDEAAPESFEYELKVSEGAEVMLEEGAVRLVNEQSQGLVIPKPWVVDAKGERREDVVQWWLGEEWGGVRKLVLGLRPAGLSYPVVVDPGWAVTGNLNHARALHTATLLANGKVLVAGGQGSSLALRSAELYDPATGVWTFTGRLNFTRIGHTATLLPDGKVLVAGGHGGADLLPAYTQRSAELYDPATGAWTFTGPLNKARQFHTATLLPDGKVLVAGGYYFNQDHQQDTTELYNPATGAWTYTGRLNIARIGHTATLLPDGKVLVTGGNLGSRTSAELYDPATGVWTPTGSLIGARYGHTATLLPDGKVLIAGGITADGTVISRAALYDPATGAWAPTRSLNTARTVHTATLLANGKVLVAGGWGGPYLTSAELYDPATGAWTPTRSLNEARMQHTATLLPDGKVLVAGGYGTWNPIGFGTNYLNGVELYYPGLYIYPSPPRL